MSRKIITFLGTTPRNTEYEYGGKPYPGKVFAEALYKFVAFDEMYVFVTKEAKEKSYPVLEKLQDRRIKPMDIDLGKDVSEMWGWFDKILECVESGDTVIFDITHGLRSIPFLVFLFAAFLKSAKNVIIEAIYYGAYELGDSKTGKPAPVIDLSEFVSMLDWLTATEQFVQTGNARALSELLNPTNTQQGSLFEAASMLNTISQAARLCQPFTLMQEVGRLGKALEQAQQELQIAAPPFWVLKKQIVDTFGQFQNDGGDEAEMLRTEFRLIEWYYFKGQIIQAVTLAREWLIDAVTYRLGQSLDYLIDKRRPFEEAISGISLLGKPHPQDRERTFTEDDLNRWGLELLQWPERAQLAQLWVDLKKVRNSLDHAEHQRKKEKEKTLDALQKLQNKIDAKIMPELRTLAKDWGFV
ncbi:MAG: TIGR02221 family CRISPR-associated protein [Gammaproteobacteria bacterium]|nr:MAG: TIGR02221 family CRISPR-associated protein [Gammaproteobacteria bacterium]